MNPADKHNFGQSVTKIRRASETWFRKPRTVFWEWLFFGNTSPLAGIFAVSSTNGEHKLAPYLFNLEIDSNGPLLGYAREIEPSQAVTLQPSHYYGFGVLLAYSFIFGIRDLHRENLILTETHFQPVDAEIVFTRLILPGETLLLPFKTIGYEFAGIGSLASSVHGFTSDQIQQIFSGYFDLYLHAIQNRDDITHALCGAPIREHPCRVIVRNTSEYAKHFIDAEGSEFLGSESVQLLRGDIPYFFKYVGRQDLLWHSAPGVHSVETSLGRFQPDIDRHGIDPLRLAAANLSSDLKMIHGAMQLLRHFAVSRPIKFALKDGVSLDSNRGTVAIRNVSYAAR